MHIPFFRIFYSTTFTVLTLILIGLLLITPADAIYQAYGDNKLSSILIIAGVYILTLIVAILIYSVRLYTNRTHLASGIPKSWIPIRKSDISKSVRRLIVINLHRSASIAYHAHPRDVRTEEEKIVGQDGTIDQGGIAEQPQVAEKAPENTQQPREPPAWGTITHPGYNSPSHPTLPSLHFSPVILELPHLLEARAVSLAPPDPLFPPPSPTNSDPQPPLPSALAVSLLQRPPATTLRAYLAHLSAIGTLPLAETSAIFLDYYERARFGPKPLEEAEFAALMAAFADVLRGMQAPEEGLVAELHREYEGSLSTSEDAGYEDDDEGGMEDADEASQPSPHNLTFFTPALRQQASEASLARSEGTVRTRSRARSRVPSQYFQARTQQGLKRMGSRESGSSRGSGSGSGSGGSVIRLAEARGPLDLPYTFVDAEG